jgi:hypothetical protein
MAELTREQLEAAEERAATHSLSDADVALQTSDTLPEGVKVEPTRLDTAGSDQHGAVYSFTRGQVIEALDGWPGGRSSGKAGASRSSGGKSGRGRGKSGSGRGRRSSARATGATETPVPPPTETGAEASATADTDATTDDQGEGSK